MLYVISFIRVMVTYIANISWGKQKIELEFDPSLGYDTFQAQIQSFTNVPPNRQKILGIKGSIHCNTNLESIVNEGTIKLMLIGTPLTSLNKSLSEAEANKSPENIENDIINPPKGLKNLGNTCYLNSALQLLNIIQELPFFLKEYLASSPTSVLEASLQTLFDNLNKPASGNQTDLSTQSIAPVRFVNQFRRENIQFDDKDDHGIHIQQDAQEALTILFQKWQQVLTSKYKYLISGELEKHVEHSKRMELFTILSCPVLLGIESLEGSIECLLKEEVQNSNTAVPNLKQLSFNTLPSYMFIHFVRFAWKKDTKNKVKSLKQVKFPLRLDMYSFCSETLQNKINNTRKSLENIPKKGKNQTSDKKLDLNYNEGNITGLYELCGIISHKGSSANCGHYISWIKKSDKWFVIDDDNSDEVSEKQILDLAGSGSGHIAYVLMYRTTS